MDRLHALLPLAGQGEQRQACQQIEELRTRPAGPVDQRGLHNARLQRQRQQYIVGRLLAQVIAASSLRIGAECRHLHHAPHAGRDAGPKERDRRRLVQRVEALRALLAQEAHGVDHHVDAMQSCVPVGRVQVAREVACNLRTHAGQCHAGPAHHRHHLVAGLRERERQVAADEAGGARQQHPHGVLPRERAWCLPRVSMGEAGKSCASRRSQETR